MPVLRSQRIYMKMLTRFLPLLTTAALLVPVSVAQDVAVRVAVANPSRILQQMQETQDKNKALKDEQAKLTAEGQKKVEDMKALQEKLKFSAKGSKDYNEMTSKLLQMRVELQAWDEVKKAELTRQHKEEIKALFEKIEATITTIAQEKKIDLVVTDFGADIPEDLDPISPEDLHRLINSKNVLFTAKGVDISAEVTARLDAAYKK